MQKPVFQAKAAEMGDFYVYYTRPSDREKTFLVGTADLESSPYIKEKVAKRKSLPKHDSEKEVVVWDYNKNGLVVLPYQAISKLVPLQTVLKNG